MAPRNNEPLVDFDGEVLSVSDLAKKHNVSTSCLYAKSKKYGCSLVQAAHMDNSKRKPLFAYRLTSVENGEQFVGNSFEVAEMLGISADAAKRGIRNAIYCGTSYRGYICEKLMREEVVEGQLALMRDSEFWVPIFKREWDATRQIFLNLKEGKVNSNGYTIFKSSDPCKKCT